MMAYKTILVHLDRMDRAENRIRIAINLAMAEDACLVGVSVIGVSTKSFYDARIYEKDPALASHLSFLEDRARGFTEAFIEKAKAVENLSYEGRVIDGEANYSISIQARFSDLVVLGRANLEEEAPLVQPDFPEFVLMNAGRPVLIIPPDYEKESVGSKVLVAWNATSEARRAVTDSIPLLKRADVVEVAMFNIDVEPEMRDQNAISDFATFLSRHGVNAHMLEPQQARHVGQALLSLAEKRGSDLLVLGGYGHTRFRQFLLGGVTRTILTDTKVPVLMSH